MLIYLSIYISYIFLYLSTYLSIFLYLSIYLSRRNLPGFDLANYRQQRSGRPVKNVLFNLIELADNVEGFKNYTEGR